MKVSIDQPIYWADVIESKSNDIDQSATTVSIGASPLLTATAMLLIAVYNVIQFTMYNIVVNTLLVKLSQAVHIGENLCKCCGGSTLRYYYSISRGCIGFTF